MLKVLSYMAALMIVSAPVLASGTEGIIEGDGACVADANGNYPETMEVTSGNNSDEGGYYAEGPGCMAIDIQRAYDLTKTHGYMKWNAVDEASEPAAIDSDYDVSYLVDYKTTRFFITARWKLQWNHTVIRDADDNITEVIITYNKHSGTSMLKHWAGTVHLKTVAPGVTAIAVRNEFNGSRIKRKEVISAAQQLHDKLLGN